MKTFTKEELDKVLELHAKYLRGEKGGERADLSKADLFNANLYKANLSFANLSKADLFNANLSNANLSKADLFNAYLSYANLSGAHMAGKSILTFQFEKHPACLIGDELRIGCMVKSVQEWTDSFRSVGQAEGYTEKQIEAYGQFIKLCSTLKDL